jgi:hypothetical protein
VWNPFLEVCWSCEVGHLEIGCGTAQYVPLEIYALAEDLAYLASEIHDRGTCVAAVIDGRWLSGRADGCYHPYAITGNLLVILDTEPKRSPKDCEAA